MRIQSFDVFDTLLTRVFAVPRDLFLELGSQIHSRGLIELSPEQFAESRCESELKARIHTLNGEVNLHEIYDELASQLGWSNKVRDDIKAMELALEEESIKPVPGMVNDVEKVRQQVDRVLFLSDMYLPRDFIQNQLKRYGFFKEGDELLLSNELHLSKSTGQLFSVVKEGPAQVTHWLHVGDNSYSDVEIPRRLGIKAEKFSKVALTRYEITARGKGIDASLWRSKLAGAMRLSRLENPEKDSHRQTIWNTGCDVIGPLLFGFVHWCLEEAVARGLKRLYFVSRDGQILQRIASKIVEAWGYDMECRYLYGSRQAWHPAAITSLRQEDLEWILESTRFLSVKRIFDRLGMKPEPFIQELEAAGFARMDWERNLDEVLRLRMGELLLCESMKSAIEKEAVNKRTLALSYLKQEGLGDGVAWAMVDIGWRGRLQDSLTKLLGFSINDVSSIVTGYYFGLVGGDISRSDQLRRGYWNNFSGGLPMKTLNWAMIEIFTAADHGAVVGYERRGERIEPLLMRLQNEEALHWGLEIQQKGVLRFVDRFLEMSKMNDILPKDLRIVLGEILNLFYRLPAKPEAGAFGQFPYSDDQYASSLRPFLPKWSCGQMTAAIFKRKKRPAFWWVEGNLALQSCLPLKFYVILLRIRECLCI